VDEMTTRPYAGSDCAALAELMNAIGIAAGLDPFFAEADIREQIAADIQDPARDTRVVVAPGGAIAGAGMVTAPPQGGTRAGVEGGVHPQWRGCGIGRELLAWQLGRLAELHLAQDPDLTWTAVTGTSVNDESAVRLFQRFGLRPVRYFVEMAAPTAGLPAVPLSGGIRTAVFTPDLRAAVYEAHMEAFADHWGYQRTAIDQWAIRSTDSELFRADLSRVALDGDEVAAYLLGYDAPGDRLYIGQIGTRRQWRKQGLASALVTESLTAAAGLGIQTAWLGVDSDNPTGAFAIYKRLGFVTQHAPYAAYETELSGEAPANLT
jgi:mycothiol synthase